MSELKPCPFCAGNKIDPEGWQDGNGTECPECMTCGATAPDVETWNRRTTENPINWNTADAAEKWARDLHVRRYYFYDNSDAECVQRVSEIAALLREKIAEEARRIAALPQPITAETVRQAAHDLLCWTYQHCINVDPNEYSRNVKDLHPGVFNLMNEAERVLYTALLKDNETIAQRAKQQEE